MKDTQSSNESQDPQFYSLPFELKALRQWVVCRYPESKAPLNPRTLNPASATDRDTWGSFKQAVAAVRKGRAKAIGFVFTRSDPFVGLDLDNCLRYIDAEDYLHPTALQILEYFDSYTERSISNTGLHILIKARKRIAECRTTIPGTDIRIEIYSHSHYFIMTAHILRAYVMTAYGVNIEEEQDRLDEVCRYLWPVQESALNTGSHPSPPRFDDQEVLDKVWAAQCRQGAYYSNRFELLWMKGRWEDFRFPWDDLRYPSQSEADQALMNLLVYYTQDVAQLKRLFRQSALGQRPKAYKEDYLNRTIAKAKQFAHKWAEGQS